MAKRIFYGSLSVAFAAFLLAGASTAGAQVFFKDVQKCEVTSANEIAKWGAKRGDCIGKCFGKKAKGDPRDCTTGDLPADPFDLETQACVDALDLKYDEKVVGKCTGFLPNCGSYSAFSPNDAAGFAASQRAAQSAQIDPITEAFFFCDKDCVAPPANVGNPCNIDSDCDDTPGDGLCASTDKVVLACETTAVKSLGSVAKTAIKCLSKCVKRRQAKGEMTAVGTLIDCDPNHFGGTLHGTLDSETDACIQAGIDKEIAKINDKCPTLPVCGAYLIGGGTAAGTIDFATSQIFRNYSLKVCDSGLDQGNHCDDDADCSGLCVPNPGYSFCFECCAP